MVRICMTLTVMEKRSLQPFGRYCKGLLPRQHQWWSCVRNVYGAGAMGSVGGCGADANSGKTTITISGGRIGYDGDGKWTYIWCCPR